jgi:hypothetical protein
MQGVLVGWGTAPLVGCVGWCFWQLIKLGLEDHREKKAERLKKIFRDVLNKP